MDHFPIIPATDRKLRFVDLAYAVDASIKATRKMLQNPALHWPSGAPDGDGWHSFSALEVSVFALTRRLVDFGFKIGDASEVAIAALQDAANGADINTMLPDDLSRCTAWRYLVISFPKGVRVVETVQGSFDEQLPLLWTVMSQPAIVLPLGEVVHSSLHRAFAGGPFRTRDAPMDQRAAVAKTDLLGGRS